MTRKRQSFLENRRRKLESSQQEIPSTAVDAGVVADSPPEIVETKAEPSMLDAVTAALHGTTLEESPPSDPGKVVASAPKVEAAKDDKPKVEEDLTPEELKRLPEKTQKRITKLLEQRREIGVKLSEIEPKAAQYDVITRQIRDTGLNQADLNVGFSIMTALKKGDLFEAQKLLAPIMSQVSRATGGVMPNDLAEEVASKAITPERARELSVARAAAEVHANRQQLAANENEARQTQELTGAIVESVNTWEKTKAAADPDWKLKSPEVMRALKLSLLEGNRPKSTQDAIKMAEDALKEVDARLKAYRPAPRAIRPAGAGVGASSRSQAVAPKNMLDIVNQLTG